MGPFLFLFFSLFRLTIYKYINKFFQLGITFLTDFKQFVILKKHLYTFILNILLFIQFLFKIDYCVVFIG